MFETHTDGPYCATHGCAKCGHVILADSEGGPELLCAEHYEAAQPQEPPPIPEVAIFLEKDGRTKFVTINGYPATVHDYMVVQVDGKARLFLELDAKLTVITH